MQSRFIVGMFLLLVGHTTLRAQFKVPVVVPVSPDAAALFKVLERPVGSYTGTVPVSFPLYTLQSGPLSLPVTLDYNSTGGIRVEEAAGSVGLGFALTGCSNRISRVMHDKPDEKGMLYLTIKPSTFNCNDRVQMEQNADNRLDLEPDIFMYSFNGQSGRFFFKEDGTIVQMQASKLVIVPDMNSSTGIRGWTITDEQGNMFYFGRNKANTVSLVEVTTVSYENIYPGPVPPGNGYASGWPLTEVYDMNGQNSIRYTYEQSSIHLETFSGSSFPMQKLRVACQNFDMLQQEVIAVSNISENLPVRIDGSLGYMLFNNTPRLDGGKKVSSIKVYDITGHLVKDFHFNYDYFTSPSGEKRLKLKNYAEFGRSSTDSLLYSFNYEESVQLPARLSRASDFWGYYNGHDDNWTFLPNIAFKFDGVTVRYTNYGDRYPDFNYAKACVLKKITYPTGGYREFIYEGNQALLATYDQLVPDPDYSVDRTFTRSDFAPFSSPSLSLSHQFTVNSNDGGTVFTYTLNGVGPYCPDNYTIKLYHLSSPADPTGGTQLFSYSGASTFSRDLVNGYYRIEVYKETGCTLGSITGSWKESSLSAATIVTPTGTWARNNRKVGGLRIKELRDYDPVSGAVNSTLYYYKLYSTDSSFTSGVLASPVRMVNVEHGTHIDCQYFKLFPSSCYPLATAGGSYVVYPEVRTVENGNGRIDRRYSFIADALPSILEYPVVPGSDYSHARGNLLAEMVYDQQGALLKKKTFSYSYGATDLQKGVRAKGYYNDASDTYDREFPRLPHEYPIKFLCSEYHTIGQYSYIFASTDSTFTSAGKYGTSATYRYYSDKGWPMLKQVRTSSSKGAVRQTTYRYAFNSTADFTFDLTAAEQTIKTTLLNRNYLQPLEVVDSLDTGTGAGILLGGTKLSFGTFNGSNLHPARLRTYTTASAYTEDNMSAYDLKGNLTEKYRTNGVREVYLWGYNSGYPVAKIAGGTYAAAIGLINSSVVQNTATPDNTMRTELNKVRSGLAAALVTTYTYDLLTGLSSETDPSGRTTYYEYDQMGRLKAVKDRDGKILRQIDYRYYQPITY